MNQKPIIRLDYLCSEPFWKFKKENGIDYCKVCKHTITDFTHLENEELIKVLKEQKEGFCGKYYEDQLIIDDQTKKGPSLYKIILASTIASIAVPLNASNLSVPFFPCCIWSLVIPYLLTVLQQHMMSLRTFYLSDASDPNSLFYGKLH